MIGCILIPGYLNPSEQVDLLTSALSTYTLPPNPLSLSTHYDLPPNLFGTYMTDPEYKVQTLFSKLSPDQQEAIRTREQEIGHRVNKESKSGSEVGYEKILQSGKVWEGDVPGSQLSERSVGELMKELRWANLGWVYRVSLVCLDRSPLKRNKLNRQWTTKSYDFDTQTPIPFPTDLGEICTSLIRRIPWNQVFGPSTSDDIGWENWKDDYRMSTRSAPVRH
jgi:alkylated DNA repair protein alkB family protein 1